MHNRLSALFELDLQGISEIPKSLLTPTSESALFAGCISQLRGDGQRNLWPEIAGGTGEATGIAGKRLLSLRRLPRRRSQLLLRHRIHDYVTSFPDVRRAWPH